MPPEIFSLTFCEPKPSIFHPLENVVFIGSENVRLIVIGKYKSGLGIRDRYCVADPLYDVESKNSFFPNLSSRCFTSARSLPSAVSPVQIINTTLVGKYFKTGNVTSVLRSLKA